MFLEEKRHRVWIASRPGSLVCVNWKAQSVALSVNIPVVLERVYGVKANEEASQISLLGLTSTKFWQKDEKKAKKKTLDADGQVILHTGAKNDYLYNLEDWGEDYVMPNHVFVADISVGTDVSHTLTKLTSIPNEATHSALSLKGEYLALYQLKESAVTLVQFAQSWNDTDVHVPLEIATEGTVTKLAHGTSIAVSDSGLVALGFVSGTIEMFYDIFGSPDAELDETVSTKKKRKSKGTRYVRRALRWHGDAVLTLAFSLDDNYLLSGGMERVLVFWQLDSNNTQFLPRLPGPITTITVDPTGELYALNLEGKELIVLSALDLLTRLQVCGSNIGFANTLGYPVKEAKKAGRVKGKKLYQPSNFSCMAKVHPTRPNHLYIFTGARAQIQIYDIAENQEVAKFEVAPAVQLGKVRGELKNKDAEVTFLEFSADGQWMVTVDEQANPKQDFLLSSDDVVCTLRFWKWSNTVTSKPGSAEMQGSWQLATKVVNPHNARVLSLLAHTHNGEPTFNTLCKNGALRVWKHSVSSTHTGSKSSWSVRNMISASPADLPSGSMAYSEDGSVLTVGVGEQLTVYRASNLSFVTELPNFIGSRIRDIYVMRQNLICFSMQRLAVFDLVQSRVMWSMEIWLPLNGHRYVAFDAPRNRFAFAVNVFDENHTCSARIMFMSPKSPGPLFVQTLEVAASSLEFLPNGNLVVVDTSSNIHVLKETTAEETEESAATKEITQFTLPEYRETRTVQVGDHREEILIDSHQAALSIESFDNVFDGADSMESMFEKLAVVVAGNE
ncbi:U3 small nucleolar RNA-associated protein 17 [Yarrowia sp. B02]|nr:U3 small nucleolar RNA-associated protein 17 [Yarrowia sp. B02]